MPQSWERGQGSLMLDFTQEFNLQGLYDKHFIELPS